MIWLMPHDLAIGKPSFARWNKYFMDLLKRLKLKNLVVIIVGVQDFGWATNDNFGLHPLRKEQGDNKGTYAYILCWRKCIEKHVICKHFILLVNNI
jgi:hypothetical protein